MSKWKDGKEKRRGRDSSQYSFLFYCVLSSDWSNECHCVKNKKEKVSDEPTNTMADNRTWLKQTSAETGPAIENSNTCESPDDTKSPER